MSEDTFILSMGFVLPYVSEVELCRPYFASLNIKTGEQTLRSSETCCMKVSAPSQSDADARLNATCASASYMIVSISIIIGFVASAHHNGQTLSVETSSQPLRSLLEETETLDCLPCRSMALAFSLAAPLTDCFKADFDFGTGL